MKNKIGKKLFCILLITGLVSSILTGCKSQDLFIQTEVSRTVKPTEEMKLEEPWEGFNDCVYIEPELVELGKDIPEYIEFSENIDILRKMPVNNMEDAKEIAQVMDEMREKSSLKWLFILNDDLDLLINNKLFDESKKPQEFIDMRYSKNLIHYTSMVRRVIINYQMLPVITKNEELEKILLNHGFEETSYEPQTNDIIVIRKYENEENDWFFYTSSIEDNIISLGFGRIFNSEYENDLEYYLDETDDVVNEQILPEINRNLTAIFRSSFCSDIFDAEFTPDETNQIKAFLNDIESLTFSENKSLFDGKGSMSKELPVDNHVLGFKALIGVKDVQSYITISIDLKENIDFKNKYNVE